MKLNRLERLIVNSPPRAWVQQHIELPKLLKHAPLSVDSKVLEVGCGRGAGLKSLYNTIAPATLHGFDLDAHQIEKAQKRCPQAKIWQGVLPIIPTDDNYYDGVFDFGVLHHVRDWQSALKAMAKVTKTGGHIYTLEFYKAFTSNRIVRQFLDHPQINRFSHEEFTAEAERLGLQLVFERHWCNCVGMVVLKKVS